VATQGHAAVRECQTTTPFAMSGVSGAPYRARISYSPNPKALGYFVMPLRGIRQPAWRVDTPIRRIAHSPIRRHAPQLSLHDRRVNYVQHRHDRD
jgi:hypothetical protein